MPDSDSNENKNRPKKIKLKQLHAIKVVKLPKKHVFFYTVFRQERFGG
jgi:hypothetical protein